MSQSRFISVEKHILAFAVGDREPFGSNYSTLHRRGPRSRELCALGTNLLASLSLSSPDWTVIMIALPTKFLRSNHGTGTLHARQQGAPQAGPARSVGSAGAPCW